MTAFAHCARRVAWVFAVILFLAATSGISSAQPACTNCMGLNLTGSALVTADMTPTPDLTIPASTGVGYVTTVFSGSTSPTLPNTTYPTWCVTSHDQAVQATGSYSASSSYSAATLTSNGINYILNHKQGMVLDVQYAIWVVSGDVSLADISFAPDAVAMATAALSPAGQSFVPAPGQTMGVQLSLVPANPGVQTFFIEIKNPCGLLGDFVWNDTNNNGIQETGEQGISGVTVQLQDAGGNILATTVTGAAPAGYTPAYPTGYYQFSGLCLSTYKIVIDYSQAALTGFVPSPTLAGGDRTVDSNLNGAGTVLTTAAPIDETLDFGFSAPPVTLQCAAATTASEVGIPFSVPALTVSGGIGPYTFSVVGTLPSGLSLNAATGAITGTPTASGSFSIKVVDSKGSAATGSCPFTIVAGPSLVCSSGNSGTVGTAFSSPAPTVSGGVTPYSYSVLAGDTLPAGLTLNAATGAITGTPTAAGTFHIQVRDANGAVAAGSCPYTIVTNTTPVSPVYVTYTQGGWGASPSGNNPGMILKNNFSKVYPGGSVVIGGTKKLTFTSASAIAGFLPAGGKPGVLAASATNPSSSAAGVFAGQVLALQLSVDFSNQGITTGGLANLKVISGSLSGQTIAQVLALANSVIGGGSLPSGLTLSGLNDIVNAINNNFDGGTTNLGYVH
jgi:hypothetical protein